MLDIPIMTRIMKKLQEHVPDGLLICDVSGRVMVASDPDQIGTLNLLALQCINQNGPTSAFAGPGQISGASAPLRYHNSRIGALVIPASVSASLAGIMASAVDLMYEELIASQKKQNQSQERDQFLLEWVHMQYPYSAAFRKRGEELDIDITAARTVIAASSGSDPFSFLASLVQKLLEKDDFILSLSSDTELILLKETPGSEKKFHRILSALSQTDIGRCSGQQCLNTGYQTALECLELGQKLFPDLHDYHYDYMKTALALSHLDIPGLEQDFSLLIEKGSSAQLAETAIAYIQCNGDIKKLSEQLHLHRNSIPYRLRRIQELCGKNLNNAYDLMCLYASYICYVRQNADERINSPHTENKGKK